MNEWPDELPYTLAAHQQISILYRITALKSITPEADGTGGGSSSGSAQGSVGYTYTCANDNTGGGSAGFWVFWPGVGNVYGLGSGIGGLGGGGAGFGGYGYWGGYSFYSGSPRPSGLGDKKDCPPEDPDRCELGECEKCQIETRDSQQEVGSFVDTIRSQFNDTITDIFVKVP